MIMKDLLPPLVTPSERNRSPRVACTSYKAQGERQLQLRLIDNLKLLPPPVTLSERNRSPWAAGKL